MKPKVVTYDVGLTIFNAPVSLTWTTGSAGERSWILRKDAADQRDDTQVITGITDDQIRQMMDAVTDKLNFHRG